MLILLQTVRTAITGDPEGRRRWQLSEGTMSDGRCENSRLDLFLQPFRNSAASASLSVHGPSLLSLSLLSPSLSSVPLSLAPLSLAPLSPGSLLGPSLLSPSLSSAPLSSAPLSTVSLSSAPRSSCLPCCLHSHSIQFQVLQTCSMSFQGLGFRVCNKHFFPLPFAFHVQVFSLLLGFTVCGWHCHEDTDPLWPQGEQFSPSM